jgi:ABC-2 type transport system permease protein
LSGALFPLDRLPGWLTVLTRVDPLTYGVDLMRKIMLGVSAFNVFFSLSVILGFAFVMFLIAVYEFNLAD